MLLLLDLELAFLLFLIDTSLGAVLFTNHALLSLGLFLLKLGPTLSRFFVEALFVQVILFFDLPPTSVILLIALLTSLFLESDRFLPGVLLLCEFSLSIMLICLTLQPLFLKSGCTFLLSSIGSKHA